MIWFLGTEYIPRGIALRYDIFSVRVTPARNLYTSESALTGEYSCWKERLVDILPISRPGNSLHGDSSTHIYHLSAFTMLIDPEEDNTDRI